MADGTSRCGEIRTLFTSLPVGPGRDDVPKLLRKLALDIENTSEKFGPMYIKEFIYEVDIDGRGIWPALTVYYDIQNEDKE